MVPNPIQEGVLLPIGHMPVESDERAPLSEAAMPVLLGLGVAAVCREGVGLLGMQLGVRYIAALERQEGEKRLAREERWRYVLREVARTRLRRRLDFIDERRLARAPVDEGELRLWED